MDLVEIRILVVVGDEHCEIQCGRKGKGSISLNVRNGLVMPKFGPNWVQVKGKLVNTPVLSS